MPTLSTSMGLDPALGESPQIEWHPKGPEDGNWENTSWGPLWRHEFIMAKRSSAGQDLGRMVFRRRYGAVMQPWQTSGETLPPDRTLIGKWVRLMLYDATDHVEQWVGIVANVDDEVFADSDQLAGVQTWTAYEPGWLLKTTACTRSHWYNDGTLAKERVLDWLPDFNARDESARLLGNRSVLVSGTGDDESYVFGRSNDDYADWSRGEALKYLVKRFMGKDWNVSGGIVGGYSPNDNGVWSMRGAKTVDQAIRRLVPLGMGLDYDVEVHTSTGKFTLHVWELSSTSWSFGEATLPANPSNITFHRFDTTKQSVRVVETHDHQYGTIRIVGKRAVVCCTLRPGDGTIEAGWNSTIEAAYNSARIDDDPKRNDDIRADDRFRSVYQHFMAPKDWDHQGGEAVPNISQGGEVLPSIWRPDTNPAPYQNLVKRTLNWTPLLEGFDYRNGDTVDNNRSGSTPDLLPPAVWVEDPNAKRDDGSLGRYVLVDELGVSVTPMTNAIGFMLGSRPRHLFAHDGDTEDTRLVTPTLKPAKYDWADLYATIAFESDERLVLEYVVSSGNDRVKEIFVEAELWLLAPDTVVGPHAIGGLEFSGSDMRVLRNDNRKMELAMVGALARYVPSRKRAEIIYRGLATKSWLVRQQMGPIVDGTTTIRKVYSPITSVEWNGGLEPTTRLVAGYALG